MFENFCNLKFRLQTEIKFKTRLDCIEIAWFSVLMIFNSNSIDFDDFQDESVRVKNRVCFDL